MATLYLDPIGGNDSNDGSSFANRVKTVASGLTAARIAPGDTVRVIKSPDPTLVDSSASWTNGLGFTLSGAVTANIALCESAWTASTNVTCNTTTSYVKQGTYSTTHVFAAGFTTGKASYYATGTLDLSAYQQVSFWIRASAAVASGVLTLRLCTDTAGATSVHTCTVPQLLSGVWRCVTVDLATNLNSAIASVALYAESDPGTPTIYIDNIIACKASSSADALTLNSLVGKKWNLSWAASTSYAQNDIVRPTQGNRNGLTYKKTSAGSETSGGSEPTWPAEVGATVTDNGMTWTCLGVEETWHAIKSINGTAVAVSLANEDGAFSNWGYQGVTETCAMYKREPYLVFNTTTSSSAWMGGEWNEDGTEASPVWMSGGWNTTDMSTQTGETWIDGGGAGYGIHHSASSAYRYVNYRNINICRVGTGFNRAYGGASEVQCCHFVACGAGGISTGGTSQAINLTAKGVVVFGVAGNNAGCFQISGKSTLTNCAAYNSAYNLITYANNTGVAASIRFNQCEFAGCNYLYDSFIHQSNPVFSKCVMGAINLSSTGAYAGKATYINCKVNDTSFIGVASYQDGKFVAFDRYDQTAGDHRLYVTSTMYWGTQTSERHTASGYAWKFTIAVTIYPGEKVELPLARIYCAADTQKTIKVWTRRSHADGKGRLLVRGFQLPGMSDDVYVDCQPTVNTWTESSALQFTPTAAGVVEVVYQVWGSSVNNPIMYVDDLTVS